MPPSWFPIAAAAITALVAIIGYLVTQAQARRDRKAREFADALSAVVDFVQLPYIIVRRRSAIPDLLEEDSLARETAAARADINAKVNDAQARMYFNLTWLWVESHDVAKKYDALVAKARGIGHETRQKAWDENVKMTSPDGKEPSEKSLSGQYGFDRLNDPWSACIVEMSVALQPNWRWLRRKLVRRSSSRQKFSLPFFRLPSEEAKET